MMFIRAASAAGLVLLFGAALPAHAGDNNRAFLQQVATGPLGNTLTLDQSDASGALLAGDRLSLTPALQVGQDNVADIRFEQDGSGMNENSIVLLTQGQIAGPGMGNSADVVVSGLAAFAAIRQLGSDNSANMTVASENAILPASGTILQIGNSNSANLDVSGTDVSGTINQFGSNNSNGLSVGGVSTNVTFNQFGNNGTAAPQVFSNAGNVVINQISF